GTDDGNVQITRDGGKHWTNVVANVPGLPANTWVSTIEASHFDPAVAYATFDGHATGDMKTHVYRTKDYGKTWTSLSTPELTGYAHVVREDLVNKDLLFVGTEFGLFISIDSGAHWAQFKGDLPNVAVRDIAIQPRESDLILATHGRGVYILDDLTPLRALTPEMLSKDLVMLPSRPSVLELPAGEQRADGDSAFMGRTLPEAASIVYYQKKRHIFGDLKVDIYDDKGTLLTSIQGDKRRGLNRLEWPERAKPPKVPPAAGLVENEFLFYGPQAQEGTYTVKLTKGKETYTSTFKLVPDPRSKSTPADRALQHKVVTRLYGDLAQLTYVVDATNDLRDQVKARTAAATDAQLKEQLNGLLKQLDDFRETLVSVKEGGMITGEEKLREHLGDLYGAINAYSGRPTQSEIERATVIEKQLDNAGAKLKSIGATALPPVNSALQGKNQQPINAMPREDWDKKQK
ncbi:MAG: glycosyl hydrolase, partial [Terriglobales bacterium]